MSRYMYDGINSLAPVIHADFPNAAMVAGYINGIYAWSQSDWDLFPNAVHVEVTVTASANAGDVLDVENGDTAPAQTAGWIAQRKASGYYRPTIYCSLAAVPAVRQGTGKYVLGTDYDLWVADYDGSTSDVYPVAVAKQYLNTNSYDESVVYDAAWPHRTPANPPATYPLKQGATGALVLAAQERLNAWAKEIKLSPALRLDGNFGPSTEAAVVLAQVYWHYSTKNKTWGEIDQSLMGHLDSAPPNPNWTYGAPRNLKVTGGRTSFKATWEEPANAPVKPAEYLIWVYKGVTCDASTLLPSYDPPRHVPGTETSFAGGSLSDAQGREIPGQKWTVHVAASGPDGAHLGSGVFVTGVATTG